MEWTNKYSQKNNTYVPNIGQSWAELVLQASKVQMSQMWEWERMHVNWEEDNN